MKRISSGRAKEIRIGYAFLAPWLIGFLLLTLYPTVYSVLLSLNEVRIAETGVQFRWQGLAYFNQAINVDTQFKLAVGDTLTLICCATPVIQVLALIIALLLNRRYCFRTFFRMVFFLPVIIMSGPVISRLLTRHAVDFAGEGTGVYEFVASLPSFLSRPIQSILENMVLILWFSGVQILVYLAGLQKISPDLYQAADIDGAGAWEKFWKITLPYMRPFALLCTVYTIIDISAYSENAVNTTISGHIFDFDRLYSFSAAMAWLFFLIILVLLILVYVLFSVFGGERR